MIRHKFFALFTLVFLLCLSVFSASASDTDLTFCPDVNARNYRANIGFRVQDEHFLLVDTNTGATTTLDTDFLSYRQRNIYWGENCRYLFAYHIWQPHEDYPVRFVNLYDTFTGQRIAHWRRDPFFDVIWSPTREQFILKTINGTFLMSESLREPVFLLQHNTRGKSMRRHEWDYERNQLLVIFADNMGYLMIYDMNTAITLAAIANPAGCRAPVGYKKSDDHQYVLVFTDAGYSGDPACVTIYNRNNGTTISVNAETQTSEMLEQIALSPDGRYLVTGMRALRVWDLSQLPEKFEERLPIYRHEGPLSMIQSLRFVDHTLVETTSADNLERWNVVTGERVGS